MKKAFLLSLLVAAQLRAETTFHLFTQGNSYPGAVGDLFYTSACAGQDCTIARLAIGTSGQVLKVASGLPAWATGSGGGSTSPLTTKGDVWGFSTIDARIPIGTNGQVLTADSTQTLGLKWATVTGTGTVTSVGLAMPASTFGVTGSPVTGAGTLTASFLSQSANTFLGGPTSSSGIPQFRGLAERDLEVPLGVGTKGDMNVFGSNIAVLGVGSNGQVITADSTQTLGVKWATPAAPGSVSPLTSKGDLWGFSSVDARVPIGTNGQILTADSTTALGLKWGTPSGTFIQNQNASPQTATFNIAQSDTTAFTPAGAINYTRHNSAANPSAQYRGLDLNVTDDGTGSYTANSGLHIAFTKAAGASSPLNYDAGLAIQPTMNETSLTMNGAYIETPIVAVGKTLNIFNGVSIRTGGGGTVTHLYAITSDATSGNWGVGTVAPSPSVMLDVAGAVASQGSTVTLVAGNNNNLAIGNVGYLTGTASGNSPVITGIAGGVDGRVFYMLWNDVAGSHNMAVANDSASSTAGNRIYTASGVSVSSTNLHRSTYCFVYSASAAHWFLVSSSTN